MVSEYFPGYTYSFKSTGFQGQFHLVSLFLPCLPLRYLILVEQFATVPQCTFNSLISKVTLLISMLTITYSMEPTLYYGN